jgi:hypothetical protein
MKANIEHRTSNVEHRMKDGVQKPAVREAITCATGLARPETKAWRDSSANPVPRSARKLRALRAAFSSCLPSCSSWLRGESLPSSALRNNSPRSHEGHEVKRMKANIEHRTSNAEHRMKDGVQKPAVREAITCVAGVSCPRAKEWQGISASTIPRSVRKLRALRAAFSSCLPSYYYHPESCFLDKELSDQRTQPSPHHGHGAGLSFDVRRWTFDVRCSLWLRPTAALCSSWLRGESLFPCGPTNAATCTRHMILRTEP